MRWPCVALTAIALAGCGGAAAGAGSATSAQPADARSSTAVATTLALLPTTTLVPTTTLGPQPTTAAPTTTLAPQPTTTLVTATSAAPVGTTAAAPAPLGTVVDYTETDQHWTMSITGWNPDVTAAVARSDRYGVAKATPGQVLVTVSVHTTHVTGQPDASPIGVNLLVAGPSGDAAALDVGCTVVVNPDAPRTSWLADGDSVDEQVCFELTPADARSAVALLRAPDGTERYLALR